MKMGNVTNRFMNRFAIAVLLFLAATSSFAQQVPPYDQIGINGHARTNLFHTIILGPGLSIVGSNGVGTVTASGSSVFTNLFTGSGSTGSVFSVAGDAGKFLRADGTWQPAGGSVSNITVDATYLTGGGNVGVTNVPVGVNLTGWTNWINGFHFALSNDVATVSNSLASTIASLGGYSTTGTVAALTLRVGTLESATNTYYLATNPSGYLTTTTGDARYLRDGFTADSGRFTNVLFIGTAGNAWTVKMDNVSGEIRLGDNAGNWTYGLLNGDLTARYGATTNTYWHSGNLDPTYFYSPINPPPATGVKTNDNYTVLVGYPAWITDFTLNVVTNGGSAFQLHNGSTLTLNYAPNTVTNFTGSTITYPGGTLNTATGGTIPSDSTKISTGAIINFTGVNGVVQSATNAAGAFSEPLSMYKIVNWRLTSAVASISTNLPVTGVDYFVSIKTTNAASAAYGTLWLNGDTNAAHYACSFQQQSIFYSNYATQNYLATLAGGTGAQLKMWIHQMPGVIFVDWESISLVGAIPQNAVSRGAMTYTNSASVTLTNWTVNFGANIYSNSVEDIYAIP